MPEQFLLHPHVPHGKVQFCAIGEGNPEVKSALEDKGISVLEIPAHPALDVRVSRHADMQLYDMGKGRGVIAAGGANSLMQSLMQLGFSVDEQTITGKYPADIVLNCFVVGKYLYCNVKNTSKLLLIYYQSLGVEAVNVNQGYAKCSTCIVNENSIITADISIAKAAMSHGTDVLVINSGSIALDGYNTGFIGGCCGLIACNKLAFCGKVSQHPDYIQIINFCISHGVELIELTENPLTDIGGIIPLMVSI